MKVSLIDRAARGSKQCPFLAIPIPTQRPFVAERKVFNALVRGITITDSSLDKIDHAQYGRIWALTITHNNGKVHGKYVLYNLLQTRYASNYEYYKFKQAMAKWAAKQRNKNVSVSPTGKFDKQIAKLQRELKKILPHRPINPLIPMRREYAGTWMRDRDARWHSERPVRKAIAKIAGAVIEHRITSHTAYKQLRDAGLCFKTYSQVTFRQREHYGMECESDYWKQLYKIVLSQHGRDHSYRDTPEKIAEAMQRHAVARVEYLNENAQVRSLREQITALEFLKQPVPVAQAEGIEVI